MADSLPCPRCHEPNDTGARFCAHCGASLAPEVHCPTCHALNPLGNRFCIQCGTGLGAAPWAGQGPPGGAGDGAVVDGVWERGPDELVRRVDPEDARRFLGQRSVRVPPGTIGAVVIDGVVDRIVPPGERTTLSLFDRVADFFLRRPGRTAFFLVDQRPVPVPFVVQTRATRSAGAAAATATRTQVLVSFSLPRGDRAAMGTFLAHAMGDKPSFGGAELHALVRPDVVRVTQEVLERLASAGELDYPEAEAQIRVALQEALGPRHGVAVDVSVAPLTTLASVSLRLGGAGATTLFTRDAQEVELDLVVRVQGTNEAFSPAQLGPALASAAGAYLRGVAWPEVASAPGLAALEAALSEPANAALAAFGLQLVALTVLDARTRTGQWLLGARAELERAAAETAIGRDWLAQRDAAIDLEGLQLQQGVRQATVQREAKLAEARAQMGDRESREDLADRQAALDKAQAARAGDVDRARAAVRATAELEAARHTTELERLRLEREGLRRAFEDAGKDADEARQIAKLRAMAELDREMAAAEHAQTLEKRRQLEGLDADRMIALQAAELAQAPGGAAFAQALAQRAGAEAAERHAADLAKTYAAAMAAMAEVAGSRAAASPVVAGTTTVTQVSAGAAEAAGACTSCGAALKPHARFCGACGATVQAGAPQSKT